MSVFSYHVDVCSMWSMLPCYDRPIGWYLTMLLCESSTLSMKSGKNRYEPSL